MKHERIIDADPVSKARAMIERGFPADKGTWITVYSGTLADAKKIRQLLDEANLSNVTLTYGSSTVVESSIKAPPKAPEKIKPVSPAAFAMIKKMWDTTIKQTKSEPAKAYEPASSGNIMAFRHDGENVVFAANAQVTAFTTDLQLAYVGTRARIMAMYEHVNRRVRGDKKFRTYTIDGEKVKVDDYFIWDDMYSSRSVWIDEDGNRYESNNQFQEAMTAKEQA